ncbi:hypothetical protein QJQ45_022018 [Haematococcus lacustris]|nr:hypothetical protein QJQ45_022018 [Haematococcus lacustris]
MGPNYGILVCLQALQAAVAGTAPVAAPHAVQGAGATSASHTGTRTPSMHRNTTLIPCWSKSMSSQQLQIESQKIAQPLQGPAAKDSFAVLEMEVMKFVAYCGGVTVRFRIDNALQSSTEGITWGLASTRPCVALMSAAGSAAAAPSAGSPSAAAACGPPKAAASVLVDSPSRKPLYLVCSCATPRVVVVHDILTVELSPKEDKQPVIMASLKLNDAIIMQQSLPCSSISSLQMYPFIALPAGVHVSLHEATTPSPLFTWYHPSSSLPHPDITLAELDTCIKHHTSTASPDMAASTSASQQPIEFVGSTTFSGGRQRWTIQLDNFGPHPTHIYVGVGHAEEGHAVVASTTNVLFNVQGPLRSISGSSSAAATVAAAAAQATASTSSSAMQSPGTDTAPQGLGPPRQPTKWGAWIRLPGVPSSTEVPVHPAPPQRDSHTHLADSTSSHCFVTVDLDLSNGFVRFFRNGHIISCAFQGLRMPVSPVVAFMQGPGASCQAGLVNLTKLKQQDMQWDSDRCSGDLRLTGLQVTKVSEVYGDYSTVLATKGFVSGVHLWLVRVNHLSEPDSIFIGVCRGCMPLDQDPQDLRDRTYYLSNGVVRVGGRRVATQAANFTKGDVVSVVLDADQGEVVFFRNGQEQGRARGIRGRLYPFISCDSEGDQVTLLGSYSLLLNRTPRQLADLEWDTMHHATDIELSSNCLTAIKTSSNGPSSVIGTILYSGSGSHEYHVILDAIGPDGVWVGVAPPHMHPDSVVGDQGCGWALHSDGDMRFNGREQGYTAPFKNGDVLTVCVDMTAGVLRFRRNGAPLGEAFRGLVGPLVSAATLASEESKITIQNRPTVLNTGEYTGELRWDEARAGKDLHVIDGLTVTKMANEGGDYATVLGTLCLSSGQHAWNVYINHVEDSNLFIGVAVNGHDLNADPQEMKHRTYYLSNGTIRVAGKLMTRCAEPYAEGDLITVQLDMDARQVQFLKNGVQQGSGDGLPEEVWPYISLDNIMDSITLHSSSMYLDLVQSLRWNPDRACRLLAVCEDGKTAQLRALGREEISGQGTVLGMREYSKAETYSWVVLLEQPHAQQPANFLVGVAPPNMDLNKSLGEEGCGIGLKGKGTRLWAPQYFASKAVQILGSDWVVTGAVDRASHEMTLKHWMGPDLVAAVASLTGLDYFGYFYVNGRYFHMSNLHNWAAVAKPVRGSTAKHKGKALPAFTWQDGKCKITVTLDLKEGTLKFSHAGRSIGAIAGIKAPLHAAVTLTSSKQVVSLNPGPIGKAEHTNEELVSILKARGCALSPRTEAALLLLPRDLFVPRDRVREAFRDQRITVRMADGSTMTLPPPSFVATAMEKLGLGRGTCTSFLDVGCGTAYVTALAACLISDVPGAMVQGLECVPSRLEAGRANMRALRERLSLQLAPNLAVLGDPLKALNRVELLLSNVLIPECTDGVVFDALYCDAAVSEEDLPTFLALLKPTGRMVVIIEEEAVLLTRTSADPHEYSRELITTITGDFGELEDPTPWEVQEAIVRIKDRERRRGQEQAKQDVSALRNWEYLEMAQRVQAAMQRIGELESMLQRTELRSPARNVPTIDLGFRSPARSNGVDDVRSMAKDKTRRVASLLKPSPRAPSVANSPSPLPGILHTPGLNDSCDWKAMYTTDITAATGSPAHSPLMSVARARARGLLSEQLDQEAADGAGAQAEAGNLPGSRMGPCGEEQDQEGESDDQDLDSPERNGMWGGDSVTGGMSQAPSGNFSAMMAAQASQAVVFMSQLTFDNIIDSMSVQMFSPDQIQSMISGREPMQVENRDVFLGTFKGVRVRVWRVSISHNVSYFELKRAYSKYCIAHPNIAAVLGVSIQPSAVTPTPLRQSVPQSPAAGAAAAAAAAANVFSNAAASSGLDARFDLRLDSTSRDTEISPPSALLLASHLSAATLPLQSLPSQPDSGNDISTVQDAQAGSAPGLRWGNTLTGSLGHRRFEHGSQPTTPSKLGQPPLLASNPPQPHTLWVVEEAFGDELLHARLERGLLSWQQACRIATDICKALAFLQDLRRHGATAETLTGDEEGEGAEDSVQGGGQAAVLSAYALRTIVTPANVSMDAQSTKVSVLPALLNHLEGVLFDPAAPLQPPQPPSAPLLHCDMAYIDPHSLFSEASAPSFYAFGVVLLQLLTEQGPLGLLPAVKEALDSGSLMNLIPRLAPNSQMAQWAEEYAALALKCTQPGAIAAVETELLPALEELASRLGALGSSAMSWEQVEEMLMLPLQPRALGAADAAAGRRWVRQDFRLRRKNFLEEVAKLASEGPIHKMEVRRARCLKDSIAMFAGKGHTVWRQPLKVSFLGEAGMDSGGVTREWFSTLSSAISRGSPELFCPAGGVRNQLYINPLSSTPPHLRKFQFVGLFMAKAILESSARGKELGPITLNLPLCEPLWKLLLGCPLNLMDLQLLDPTEFRSLMSILDMDIDGLIFETFAWNFHHASAAPGQAPPLSSSCAGFSVGSGYVAPTPFQPPPSPSAQHHRQHHHSGAVGLPAGGPADAGPSMSGISMPSFAADQPGSSSSHRAAYLVLPPLNSSEAAAAAEVSTPTAGGFGVPTMQSSPFAGAEHEDAMVTSIPLKPGGTHLKVTNHNKREYVLLKAHKMLVGTIEAQMTAIIDAFHTIIPRELLDKYAFTSLELQLLVCGEQRVDVQDLKRHCKYEDGYNGKEDVIAWFWDVVEGFDDAHRRHLLQFWSGSDGQPAEGFGALDPAFHIVAVERLYDPADTTARLPAAHTCFRQLDLPRYRNAEEVKEKIVTAITLGQGYMALSSQEATRPAASEPGPSTPPPAKRSKYTKAEQAAEPTQPTEGKGKAQGKAAKAKPAPQPGRWLDRDCNAALNTQRMGESKWRPLELCYWPNQGALPAKGKEYPGLGYTQLRDKPPKAQQQQQQPAVAQ